TTWHEVSRGVLVGSSGELSLSGDNVAGSLASALPVSRLATSFALFVAAVSLPLWGTAPFGGSRRALAGLSTALLGVTTFHLVAAGRAPPWMLSVAPGVLLVDAWILHRTKRWI